MSEKDVKLTEALRLELEMDGTTYLIERSGDRFRVPLGARWPSSADTEAVMRLLDWAYRQGYQKGRGERSMFGF